MREIRSSHGWWKPATIIAFCALLVTALTYVGSRERDRDDMATRLALPTSNREEIKEQREELAALRAWVSKEVNTGVVANRTNIQTLKEISHDLVVAIQENTIEQRHLNDVLEAYIKAHREEHRHLEHKGSN